MAAIVIIDDDPQLRRSLARLLADDGHDVKGLGTGEAGIEHLKSHRADLVILDLRLPGMDGMETFQAIKRIDPKLPVIIMTAYGTTETAIEATKQGAFDYVLKPFEVKSFLKIVDEALRAGNFTRSRITFNPEEGEDDEAFRNAIVGRSPVMQEVYKAIGRVAPTDATVLIRGESGTGKELVARAIYQHSTRSEKPFMVINCVAIPETLLESELFGYEKGAFTGAVSRKLGKVEQASGGTIFLDEIGDMPLSIQAKILRLLQEKKIERLGGGKPIPVDVRIIAATNRDLEAAVSEGTFRDDLYYRLKVVTIMLPPLRDRREDIPLLVNYFLARSSREMGIPNPGITEEALQFMTTLEWPGNVRELENTVRKLLIFNRGVPITKEEVQKTLEETSFLQSGHSDDEALIKWIRLQLASSPRKEHLFEYLLDRTAELIIREALQMTGGNRSQAARLLGLSRPALLGRMEKYGIRS
ncbi:sigma-54-dependent transcriptional regulator [Thermodesulforhabdus norvegica]|uniref:DNA-binding transcriptional regulator NtrC n=1 Tax=Thermodesulforhabdus norvegica TaxID=39841 RepID=A0A1I4SIB5_9BACT|nr:sigma-54 dependent transcriptional regulator [Thermodesulforhabdus norvegica]SFM64205.1 two-component system, NtrC family, nitrogen regulation response regulator GlnG [Thermodesulforhabdus norvegica]